MADDDRPSEKTSSGWFFRLFEKSLIARVLFTLSAFVGAVVSVMTAVRSVDHWYDERFRWREVEERRIESLRPNVHVDDINRKLGRPRIVTPSESGEMTAHVYQGRGYWVQAVTDTSSNVLMVSTTICDLELRPTWRMWDSREKYVAVTANRSKAVPTGTVRPSGYQWQFPGATNNVYAFVLYSGGNPTNYQTYAWGFNDACEADFSAIPEGDPGDVLSDHWVSGEYEDTSASPPITEEIPASIERVYRQVDVNTFAIFGVMAEPEALVREFQIGANRILTRTLMHEDL